MSTDLQKRWLEQRMRWEADPTYSGAAVAKEMGVSQAAVSQRIKRDGWERVSDPAELARRAAARADKAMIREATKEAAKEVAAKLSSEVAEGVKDQAVAAEMNRIEQTDDIAVEMRAKIIEQHRKEIDGATTLMYEAIRTKDLGTARLSKTTFEAMKIKQDLQRKAWGLDAAEEGKEMKVTIERKDRHAD